MKTKQISTGLIFETHGRIGVYRLTDNARDTLDAWAEHFSCLIENSATPYRVLLDVSDPAMSFTPYFRSRSQQVVDEYGHCPGRLAMVFPNRFLSTVVEFYMRAQRQKKFEPAFFTDVDKALEWLSE